MDTITMSKKELERYDTIKKVIEKRLTQPEAASILGISIRQVRRLSKAVSEIGAEGLISKHRGKPSNNRLPDTQYP